jgi:DNA-binding ferritin-like protein
MKITIELDHEDLEELVEKLNEMQIDVQILMTRLEEIQDVIQGAEG